MVRHCRWFCTDWMMAARSALRRPAVHSAKSGALDMSISGGFGGFDTEFARRPQEFSVQMVWGF